MNSDENRVGLPGLSKSRQLRFMDLSLERFALILIVTLISLPGCGSTEPAEPESSSPLASFLEEVLEAHGGAKKIDQLRTQSGVVITKGWGPLSQASNAPFGEFSMQERFQLPDKLHRVWTGSYEGRTRELVTVETGDRVIGLESNQKQFETKREGPLQVMPMATMISILDAAAGSFALKEGVALESDKRVIEFHANGQIVGAYVFDKSTHRLVGSLQTQVTSEGVIETRSVYGDYRKVDGVLLPFQVKSFREGKKVLDVQIQSIEMPANLPKALFEPPV